MLKELFGLFNTYAFHFKRYNIGLILVALKSLLVSVKMEIIFFVRMKGIIYPQQISLQTIASGLDHVIKS